MKEIIKSVQDMNTELNTQLTKRDEKVKEQANEIENLNEKIKEKMRTVKSTEKKLKELDISHQNEIDSLKSYYDEQNDSRIIEKNDEIDSVKVKLRRKTKNVEKEKIK